MSNQSIVTEFILLRFSEIPEVQIFYFVAFFIIYLTALIGNLLVIIVVVFSEGLHTPMYFFLGNLSTVDLGYISVIIPKAMANSLFATSLISYPECVTQLFFFLLLISSEFFLLTVMAYDRYVAICNPLQYERLMNRVSCIQMVTAVWIAGLINAVLHTSCTFGVTFCLNIINQFFCEIPQLLRLTCSDSYIPEGGAIMFSTLAGVGCFGFIIVSYLKIFRAVLKIPSTQGRKKAISTCLPHLIVLFLFYFTGCIAYLGPTSRSSPNINMALAMMYTIIPPFMNPIIYSIRNKEIMAAFWRLLHKNKFCSLIYTLGVMLKKSLSKQCSFPNYIPAVLFNDVGLSMMWVRPSKSIVWVCPSNCSHE